MNLTVNNIQQYYGGSHILRDVSLEAKQGEVTVLLGRNGVGKTTLLKSLMGAVPIRDGSITFNGEAIERAAPYERARAGIGYVPQGREIFARLTVEDNLRMGLATQPAGTDIPAELFELFPVLKQMLHRRGGDLSGGQQQQLAIARALASRPKLLVLDEPMHGCDADRSESMLGFLKSVDFRQTLLVTHESVSSTVCENLIEL